MHQESELAMTRSNHRSQATAGSRLLGEFNSAKPAAHEAQRWAGKW